MWSKTSSSGLPHKNAVVILTCDFFYVSNITTVCKLCIEVRCRGQSRVYKTKRSELDNAVVMRIGHESHQFNSHEFEW